MLSLIYNLFTNYVSVTFFVLIFIMFVLLSNIHLNNTLDGSFGTRKVLNLNV